MGAIMTLPWVSPSAVQASLDETLEIDVTVVRAPRPQRVAAGAQAIGTRRTLHGGVQRQVLAVGDVDRNGRKTREALLQQLGRQLQRVLERGRLLDHFLDFVDDELAPLGRLAGEIRLPGFVFFTRQRHGHL
jgi:hypothetical protein